MSAMVSSGEMEEAWKRDAAYWEAERGSFSGGSVMCGRRLW